VIARVVRFAGTSHGADEHQRRAYEELLPVLEGLDGFRGLILLGDPDSAVTLAVTLWTDERAAHESARVGSLLRHETTREGEWVASVEELQVMLFEI
jgi:heme-degrading monooxygenase HmoA